MKFLWLFLILPLSSPLAGAGSLDEFEEDVTAPKSKEKGSNRNDSHPRSSDDCGSLSSCIADDMFTGAINGLIEMTALVIVAGGKYSLERVTGTNAEIPPRQAGEPLIPHIRLDSHYQNVNGDISAIDLKLELGYGPVGLNLRHTRFRESSPADELTLKYIHALYRMSFGEQVGFNMGFGRATLEGNKINSGSSFTFPLLIHWSENLGVEASYTVSYINGNSLTDKDIALIVTHSPAALALGYRSISGPTSAIQGPFAGLSVRW